MKTKWRILLHSMTFKRDFGVSYVLAKILEHMGCECFIADNNNHTSRMVKLWNPHAVFYVTLGRTERLRKAYPRAKLFFCTGEAGDSTENSTEL